MCKGFAYLLLISSAWLVSAQTSTQISTLTIGRGDEQYPPYEWTENNLLTGIHIDLIRRAAMNLGVDLQIKSYPWKRGLRELEHGGLAALSFMGKNAEREKYTLFLEGNILSEAKITLFRRIKDTPFSFDRTLQNLEGKRIAVKSGFFYSEAFNRSGLFEKVEVSSYQHLLNITYLERVDFGVVNQFELMFGFRSDPRLQQIEFISPPVSTSSSYLGFSRRADMADLAQKFARELSILRASGFYGELLEKYGLVQKEIE